MEDECSIARKIIHQIHSSDIQGGQMESDRGVTPSILDELDFRISKEIKWKVKVVLLEVSLMKFILRISNEIIWNVKVVLLEVSLMNFILRISKDIK